MRSMITPPRTNSVNASRPLDSARTLVIAAGFIALLLHIVPSKASEESADRRTQDALAMDVHPDKGVAPFMRYCSSCHGAQGQGDSARSIPALAGQRFNYLIRQLANFRSAERDSGPMYHIVASKGFADPQAWNDVASYLSRLPPTEHLGVGDGSGVALGRGIVHEQCASCHGSDGSGDKEGFVPALTNQHYSYLVSQLHRLAEDHRHNVDQSLVLFMRSFDDNDAASVADYLSRLHGPSKSHERMLDNGVVID